MPTCYILFIQATSIEISKERIPSQKESNKITKIKVNGKYFERFFRLIGTNKKEKWC